MTTTIKTYRPQEHGFWDYTTPGAGGMEHYQQQDYRWLLDDMQRAGMNSLAITIKWLTTGYRLRLPFLDQHPQNAMTASDNQLLHAVLAEARSRGINIWLSAVVTVYPPAKLKSPATMLGTVPHAGAFRFGYYDLDSPEVTDYALQVYDEIATLFPGAHGLIVEVEDSGWQLPHRAAPYNRWAKEHGRPRFAAVGRPLQCRIPALADWRDYTTHRRVELMRQIERVVRARGFRGPLAMLCETGRRPYQLTQEVNVQEFHRGCPRWSAVSYEYAYDKSRHRHGMMELAVEEPQRAGLRTYYLPRGVMTFIWPLPISLRENWRRDLEDIARYRPEGVWWFGSGGLRGGAHVDVAKLRRAGFASGRAARRALLRQISRFADES